MDEISLLTPFNTLFLPDPSMSASDIQGEVARLWRRQTAIDAVLHGELDDDILYDLLAEDGINPNEWAQQAIENIEIIMGENL